MGDEGQYGATEHPACGMPELVDQDAEQGCEYDRSEGTDEELRTILVVERSVASALFLLQNVNLAEEVSVRSD